MLTIKSNNSLKSPFNNLNISLPNKGLVFICGKKESSAKNLVKYVGGIEYLPGLEIEIDGFKLDDKSKLEDYRLYNIGFIFANVHYIENETVLANVLSSSSLFSEVIEDKFIDECLEKVGLLEYKNTNVSLLSEYQLHCLDIARALVKDPKVLLANNPIARLSNEEVEKIWSIIEKLSHEYLVIVGNALRAKAKEMANIIISFESNEVNHSLVEKIEIIPNKPEKYLNDSVVKRYEKTNAFSFKNLFKISGSLLSGGIFVMVLFALTITLFLISCTATNKAHENFAQSLHDNEIKKVIMMRNTEMDNFVISKEVRDRLDNEFPELSIQWGYYISNDTSEQGYVAHAKATGYYYPEAMFRIGEDEINTTYKLIDGSWSNDVDGVYISKTEAEEYMAYINENYNNTRSHANLLRNLYEEIYPTPKVFTNINELIGEKMILAYNTKNLTVLKIAGIFEDNLYSNNIVITGDFSFPNLNPSSDPFNVEEFYSVGVVTLTDDVKLNAKFLNYNATIIRNERESLILSTDLDAEYSVLYEEIKSLVTPLNIFALVGVVLTVASAVIYFALLIGNYRRELTLARTYGLSKNEIIKVSAIVNSIISLIAFVAAIILTILVVVIYNSVIKGTYAFVSFSYFAIPVYAILIAFAAIIVFTGIFIKLSVEALNKSDYLVY